MKKTVVSLFASILLIFTLTLCACGDKSGTYFPTTEEMKANLENGGYHVTVTTDLGDKNGTHLSATKENESIEFYWLENSADCDYFYNLLKETYPDYHSLVQIENDETFGNLVFCGTENAVNVAGIRIVTVKVKV